MGALFCYLKDGVEIYIRKWDAGEVLYDGSAAIAAGFRGTAQSTVIRAPDDLPAAELQRTVFHNDVVTASFQLLCQGAGERSLQSMVLVITCMWP